MAYKTSNMDVLIPLIMLLPDGQHFDTSPSGDELSMQASGEEVNKLRKSFGGVWTKHKQEGLQWWEYIREGKNGEPTLKIYADRVGPKSCRRIVEEAEEVVHVPAREAHDEVIKRTVVRWECDE